MSIKFRCESCHKTVEAPDSAAGKRGRCPYCGHSCYIASPMSEDIIPLAVGGDEESPGKDETQELTALDRELLSEMGRDPSIPLEERDDLSSEDLHHLVVNYCLDMFNGNLARAEGTAEQLGKFKFTARQAVEDFRLGKADEDALKVLPPKVRKGFLEALAAKMK